MSIGSVELSVVRFPGDRFTGWLAASLQHLVDTGVIRVIDVPFAGKEDQRC